MARATPRPWRFPRKPRVVRTPKPAPPPPSSRRPTPRPALLPIAFEPVMLRGRSVGVSSAVKARFSLAELVEAIEQHGLGRTGAHHTKHRFRAGTFTVISNSSRGEAFIVTPAELRILFPPKRPR